MVHFKSVNKLKAYTKGFTCKERDGVVEGFVDGETLGEVVGFDDVGDAEGFGRFPVS